MIVTCKECGTDFNLNEELIKQTGSKVRCFKCKKVFVVYPTMLQFEIEADDEDDLRKGKVADEQMTKEKEEELAETFDVEDSADELKPEKTEESGESDVEAEEELITADKKPRSARRKRISVPVTILLVITLLGGSIYGALILLDRIDIRVPFASDLLKPEAEDVYHLKMDVFDVTGNFVENSRIGKLFVIRGHIKNEYEEPRSFIRMTGKLYTKGTTLSQAKTVYCGNILSNFDLENLDLDAIHERLKNRLGDNRSNVMVKPGSSLPFMLVFSNLPDDLEEFTVEVAGSSAAEM